MYLLRLNTGGTMVYEGVPADPSSNPISLATNWNWIGYIPQVAMGVTEATASSPITADDYIKSQTTSATYYDGFGFYPSFDMVPGGGYMLKLANGGDLTYMIILMMIMIIKVIMMMNHIIGNMNLMEVLAHLLILKM